MERSAPERTLPNKSIWKTLNPSCYSAGIRVRIFSRRWRYLAETLDMGYVCIDRLEGDGLTARTVAVWNDGKFEDNVSYALKDTPCGSVVGKVVCSYPRGVCQLFPQDATLQRSGRKAYVGTTLWSFDGKPIGLIAVIGQKPMVNPSLVESVLKVVAVRGRRTGTTGRREDLRESEGRLKLAQFSAGAGMWDWDTVTGKFEWSDELFNLYGLDPRTTTAGFDAWRSAIHPDDRIPAEKRIDEAIQNHTSLNSEYRIVFPSGEVRWVNALGNTTYDEVGSPQHMSGICINITAQTDRRITARKRGSHPDGAEGERVVHLRVGTRHRPRSAFRQLWSHTGPCRRCV